MAQRFIARKSFAFDNGAIGWGSNSPIEWMCPFAKVNNCPIAGTSLRLTCYATGYADTAFSIPACTRYKGKHVRGFFTSTDDGTNSVEFRVMDSHKHMFEELS